MTDIKQAFEAVTAQLTSPGAPWEVRRDEDGVAYYPQAPANLVQALAVARQHGDREFLVYEGERRSFNRLMAEADAIAAALQDSGVVKVVNFTGQPAPIPDRQIEDLKRVISSGTEVTTTTEKFEQGDMVEITRGPLSGISGMLAEIKGKYRLILRIENMHHAILVTVHPGFVKKIKKT
jgi:hypothetical protein